MRVAQPRHPLQPTPIAAVKASCLDSVSFPVCCRQAGATLIKNLGAWSLSMVPSASPFQKARQLLYLSTTAPTPSPSYVSSHVQSGMADKPPDGHRTRRGGRPQYLYRRSLSASPQGVGAAVDFSFTLLSSSMQAPSHPSRLTRRNHGSIL